MLLRWFTLALALMIGGALTVPEIATASPDAPQSSVCKRKKRKKSVRRKRRRAKRAKRRITAKTIKRWQRKGYSNKKIVRLAKKRGYKLTKKERRRLRRYKVRRSLRKALKTGLVAKAAPPKAPKKKGVVDLEETIDPNDIDFDSVPPPEGMDMRFADMHRAEAEAEKGRRK